MKWVWLGVFYALIMWALIWQRVASLALRITRFAEAQAVRAYQRAWGSP